ncbi:hypothetical protein SERLADRAFT_388718 [Serpula lacrymans var. lacrymans S7.9]|uniref:Uncharacterized protein n=1 Tax=Serpula lacrymans var. lacrymans (strain S7.9) TaxID=578457 RepID=F8NV17_SERL9|nr:uncharacterized protein SERLADRAFT_388718 [Serpula lacrymans var. lacrymans S7.9]EGO25972.1 hypothetical protein SERLADRAFT_388718 [Serpula lacrymans var. lacrymans S7.9]
MDFLDTFGLCTIGLCELYSDKLLAYIALHAHYDLTPPRTLAWTFFPLVLEPLVRTSLYETLWTV